MYAILIGISITILIIVIIIFIVILLDAVSIIKLSGLFNLYNECFNYFYLINYISNIIIFHFRKYKYVHVFFLSLLQTYNKESENSATLKLVPESYSYENYFLIYQ